jgi:hypothetical protein
MFRNRKLGAVAAAAAMIALLGVGRVLGQDGPRAYVVESDALASRAPLVKEPTTRLDVTPAPAPARHYVNTATVHYAAVGYAGGNVGCAGENRVGRVRGAGRAVGRAVTAPIRWLFRGRGRARGNAGC